MNTQIKVYQSSKKKQMLLPLYSTKVKAGFPSPADDFIENILDLNELLISHPSETYLVRVSGKSMKNAGIFSEDILIVDRSLSPYEGCIAIVTLDGEFTVKRIKKLNGELYLIPENPQFKPIKIHKENELMVWGIVTYIIHKCK